MFYRNFFTRWQNGKVIIAGTHIKALKLLLDSQFFKFNIYFCINSMHLFLSPFRAPIEWVKSYGMSDLVTAIQVNKCKETFHCKRKK